MKKSSVAVLILAAATFARADQAYHTIVSGEDIQLFDSSTSAALSYVELKQNAKRDGTVYEMAQSANGTAPIIVVYLNNETAGDYLFYFKGSSKNAAAKYTATITGVDDATYSKTFSGAQTQTSNWSIDTYGTDHTLLVKSLPVGKFTLTFTVACSNGWMGHYGNFTFTKIGGTLDIANNLNADLDLGTPFTDSSDKFGSQTTEDWVVLERVSTDTTHSRLLLENSGYSLGSTKHGDTVTFYLYNSTKATYRLSYKAGTASGNTGVSIAWTLTDATTEAEVYSGSNDVTPNASNTWTLSNEYTDSFGALPVGYYILKATVQRPTAQANWACNFGYFSLAQSFTLELDGSDGATIELDEDSPDREVVISNNPTVDLMGHDLTLNVSSTTFSGTLAVTNSDTENTGVLTLKGAVTTTWLQSITVTGNVKLVVDGNATNEDPKFATSSGTANTHIGGTVFQNQTRRVYSYGIAANFGTGALGFAGDGYVFLPSGDFFDGYTNIANNIEINGTGNRFNLEGPAWVADDLCTFTFSGRISGSGELYMSNGWRPFIKFASADTQDFTGTIKLSYSAASNNGSGRGYYFTGDATGFASATVCLTNNSEATALTRVTFEQTADDVYFGHLVTDDETPEAHSNTWMIAKTATTLRVGATNRNGHFVGAFKEDGGTFKLYKEGTGTWELCSTNSSTLTSGIEVACGTLVANSIFTGGAVQVDSGATLAGTGTVASVTFSSGAILSTTNMTVTGWSYFQSHGDVTSAAPKVFLDPDMLVAGKTYTILKSNGMPGSALLHEDMTNQIAGVKLTQQSNTLSLTVPAHIVAPGGKAENFSASSEEGALAAVAIRLTDDDIDAGRKTSYYKKVATETSSGFWSVEVKLADEVEVEIGADTTPSVTASTVTFSTPKNLKQGLYYGVASGTSVGSLACTQKARYDGDGTTPPTLSADMPDSGVMYYSIEVSDTAKSSN